MGDAESAQEVRPQPRAVVTEAGFMVTDGELGQSAARPPPGGAAAANGAGEGRARGTPGRAVGGCAGGGVEGRGTPGRSCHDLDEGGLWRAFVCRGGRGNASPRVS